MSDSRLRRLQKRAKQGLVSPERLAHERQRATGIKVTRLGGPRGAVVLQVSIASEMLSPAVRQALQG